MKVVIPVAGVGTNLRPHTYTQPKPLIPIAGRPIISHILDELISSGFDDFIFIIGYLGDTIKSYIDHNYSNISREYVYQENRLGSGHSLWIVQDYVKDEKEFLIIFGDTLIEINKSEFNKSNKSILAIKNVEDPVNFGVVEFDENDIIVRMEEKPPIPRSNVALVGLYLIRDTEVFIESLNYIIESGYKTHGEYQLTDVLMRMVSKGVKFDTVEAELWFDCGKKDLILKTNSLMLSKLSPVIDDELLKNNIILEPVYIGDNCEISNSVIGPFTSIGGNTKIDSAIIENSIIGDFVQIKHLVMKESIIGNDSIVTGSQRTLNIGDNTGLKLG